MTTNSETTCKNNYKIKIWLWLVPLGIGTHMSAPKTNWKNGGPAGTRAHDQYPHSATPLPMHQSFVLKKVHQKHILARICKIGRPQNPAWSKNENRCLKFSKTVVFLFSIPELEIQVYPALFVNLCKEAASRSYKIQ